MDNRDLDFKTGWLIVKGQLCLGVECHKPSWVTFTSGFEIRFKRQQDAMAMLEGLRGMASHFMVSAWDNCTVEEHSWCGPTALDEMRAALSEGN